MKKTTIDFCNYSLKFSLPQRSSKNTHNIFGSIIYLFLKVNLHVLAMWKYACSRNMGFNLSVYFLKPANQAASQPASQPASQSVSQSVSQSII